MFKTAMIASLLGIAASCCCLTVNAEDKKAETSAVQEKSAAEGAATVQSCTFQVLGMDCPACKATLKAAIKRLDGVKDVSVSYEEKSAAVSFDPKLTTTSAIVAKIGELGYEGKVNQCKSKT